MIIVNVGPAIAQGPLHRIYLLPYGRASVLFVLIAGISMGFMLRSRRDDARRWPTLLWRATLLLLGGLALQLLTDDVTVILPVYGVLFGLALIFQHAPRSLLLGATVAMAVIGPILFVSHATLENGSHSFAPLRLGDPMGDIVHGLLLSGRYPLVTWCVPFLAGMWLAAVDLRDRTVQHRMILWGAIAAVGGFALSQISRGLLDRDADVGFGRLLTGAGHGQMPLWLVSSVGGGMFVIATLLRLGASGSHVTRPLMAAGQMGLTLYVLHVLVLALIKPSDGFIVAEGATVSAAMIVIFVAVAVLWRRFVGVGPLEWLLRASWLRSAPPAPTTADSTFTHPALQRSHDT